MRIATWNVNGLRARLDFVLHWLRARQPDIVGIQELKMTEEQFPHLEIEAAGYHAAVFGQKSWNGVAVLSKKPVTITQKGLPGEDEMGARLLSVDAGDLSFSTIYVPNGKTVAHADFPRKLAWLDTLASHFADTFDCSQPVVLCGDFNICPGPLDSWNEQGMKGVIFHTDDERVRFARLIEWGFIDLFRDRFPDAQTFSWWDYRGGAFHRKQGLRIDLVLGTTSVRARVRGIEIDRDYRKKQDGLTASDHAPVIVDLDD